LNVFAPPGQLNRYVASNPMLDTLTKIHDAGGHLVNVTCTLFEGDRNLVTAVGLRFESISVVFRANSDDDTLIASIGSLTPDADETLVDISDSSPWVTCLGAGACWLWQLTNQQGYADGVRLEFGNPDEQSRAVFELLVTASAIETLLVGGAT
jgi:hypothetical protein